MALKVWGLSSCSLKSLNDGSSDYWTDSTGTAGEYYYNQSDIAEEPYVVYANDSLLTEGTLGSLANGEWAWGDQDSLGSNTLYVKLSVGDPDGQAAGYVECTEPVTVFQADASLETAIRSLFISNYSDSQGAIVRIIRTDSSDNIKFQGKITLQADQSPFSWSDLFNFDLSDKLKIHSSVTHVSVQANGVVK